MSGMTRSRVQCQKSCIHCATKFMVPNYRKDTARYCSRRCLALAARTTGEANCAQCGQRFSFIASRANKAKYCSANCYHEAMKGRGRTVYRCGFCLIEFFAPASTKRKYCSRKCIQKCIHAHWNPSFVTVRKAMKARGLIEKCTKCGLNDQEILGVHHVDRNRKNNALENLIVLCPNCHSREHRRHLP